MKNTFYYAHFKDENNDSLIDETGSVVDDPMEEVFTEIKDPRIFLETIISHDQYQKNKPKESKKKTLVENEGSLTAAKKSTSKKTGSTSYLVYNDHQRNTFIDRMIEQPVGNRDAKNTGIELGIHPRTAQRWWTIYEETGEVPYKKSTKNKGRPLCFTQEHKIRVQELIDDNPQTSVTEVVDDLIAKFEDFSMSKSGVHQHMKTTCSLSVQVPRFEAIKKNSPENLEERYEWFMKWKDSDVDFVKNCIFIDESGFHINMKKGYAWGPVGIRPVVKVPQTRSPSHSVLGAITGNTILHVVLRKPSPRTTSKTSKKGKNNKGKKRAIVEAEDEISSENWVDDGKPAPKGTTSAHFIKFINDLLDIMDATGGMKGFYLVMDNCNIHKNVYMQRKIVRRGYNFMYLPAYSPELNPIEPFWFLVKSSMKRDKLLKEENITSRIREACEEIHPNQLLNFADHSKRQIIKCHNKIKF
jgi:hypothetical protein